MADWIKIIGWAKITKQAGALQARVSRDELDRIARQIEADAMYGTFGEFTSNYWKNAFTEDLNNLANATFEAEDDTKVRITLNLNSSKFDLGSGGLQHLLGVLAGDLFFLDMPGFKIDNVTITSVELPKSVEEELSGLYESNGYTTGRVKTAFGLKPAEPLLAFSIKPRLGLTNDALREIVLGVLGAGFQIAEFDTRYLDLTPKNAEFLLKLANDAAAVGGDRRFTRLSPNLSVPPPLAVDFYKAFAETSPWPQVVKVDGGFDGLATIQSLRNSFRDRKSPIITCYPLLAQQISSKIPRDLFNAALALSGVDIIYPGGSPRVGGGTRDLGAEERTAVSAAANRYVRLAARERPMITLAGGIYAGQLHAFYELVGPGVAYFLGGCVALHKEGPVAGARMCVRVIEEAVKLHSEDAQKIKELPGKLIEEIESAYEKPQGASETVFRYTSPASLLKQVKVDRWG